MTDQTLSYLSKLPETRYSWAPAVVLWLWVALNGVGSLLAGLLAMLCLTVAREFNSGILYAFAFLFFICALASGGWAIRVGWHALRVFHRDPDGLTDAVRATKRSYVVLTAAISIVNGAIIAFESAGRSDLGTALLIVDVPFGVISLLVFLTVRLLRSQAKVSTASMEQHTL